MRVRFWGTRGSIPVAMTSAEVQRKLVTALVARGGPRRSTPTGKAQRLRGATSSTSRSPHTFGGNSSCVQIETDGRRLRRSAIWAAARASSATSCSPSAARRAAFSRLHVPRALGPHHGLPVLQARLPARQPRSTSTAATTTLEEAFRRQNRAPCFPVDFSTNGRGDRVRATRAGERSYRDRRAPRARHAPAPRRRFLRLPLRAARQDGRLLHRLRAQAGRSGRDGTRSSSSSATPTS